MFEPSFDLAPRLPPSDEFEFIVRRACDREGTIRPEAVAWIASSLREMLLVGTANISLQIRKTGNLLSKDEVRRLGLRGNTKVGSVYLKALTDKGISEGVGAIDGIVSEVTTRVSSLQAPQGLREIRALAKLSTAEGDGGCCAAASGLTGRIIDARAADELPLPDCTQPTDCGCWWGIHVRELDGPEAHMSQRATLAAPTSKSSLFSRFLSRTLGRG